MRWSGKKTIRRTNNHSWRNPPPFHFCLSVRSGAMLQMKLSAGQMSPLLFDLWPWPLCTPAVVFNKSALMKKTGGVVSLCVLTRAIRPPCKNGAISPSCKERSIFFFFFTTFLWDVTVQNKRRETRTASWHSFFFLLLIFIHLVSRSQKSYIFSLQKKTARGHPEL